MPTTEQVVFCGRCYRPHWFERKPGLQTVDCECGGLVSLFVKTEATRWTYLEVDL